MAKRGVNKKSRSGLPPPPRKRRAIAAAATTTISELPDDVIFDILLRIKSIIRFNRVCRRWRRLILQPRFAKSHSSRWSLPLSLIFYRPSDGPTNPAQFSILELEDDDDDLAPLGRQNATVTFRSEIYVPLNGYKGRVMGACNGLVCLRVDNDVVVCNPIVQGRRPFVLPKPPKLANSWSSFGFGYSPLSDEYKVLRCNETQREYVNDIIISFEVCTLGRDDTWRSIGGGGHNGIRFPRSSMSPGIDFVFVNGALYWLGRDMASRLLCYFDVENEELGSTLYLPSQIDGIVHLEVLGEFLYLFDVHRESHVNVWVMREHKRTGARTWKQVCKLPYPCGIAGPIQPIKVFKDGTILMILNKLIADQEKYGKVLASQNPQTGLIKYHEALFLPESIAHAPSFLCPPWLL
ncbi:putative F-box protein At3g52320 [Rhododendron vialii]|uniref:putative F-box protein At3g52320 n=1 Tax=Rhododendron vialii TaxID=182163 RepID=UPI00265E4801|nr:putative F-box protein At3g52320 [Rhododendron vialii]XP_058210466.1 putative F-box protein At3g52320 [Rhododendron vialii]